MARVPQVWEGRHTRPKGTPVVRSSALAPASPVSSATILAALGNGVVAPYELALGPVPWLTAGTLMWPWEHAGRVMHTWRDWAARQPAAVTTAARIARVPHLGGMAPALRGRAFVAVDVAVLGEPWGAASRLAPLRRLEPEIDTLALMSPSELLGRGDAARAGDGRVVGESAPVGKLTTAAVDAFIAVTGPASGTDLVSAGLRHVGDGECVLVGIGVAVDDEHRERLRTELERLLRDVLETREAG